MSRSLFFLTQISQKNIISISRRLYTGYNKKMFAALSSASETIPFNRAVSYSCNGKITNGTTDIAIFNILRRWFKSSIILYEELDVIVPELPESVAEGDVRWIKKVGDSVVTDEVVCEIETDKTAIPVPAPFNGVILAHYTDDGGTIKAHQKIFRIKKGPGGPTPATKPTVTKASPPTKAPARTPPIAKPPPPKLPPSKQSKSMPMPAIKTALPIASAMMKVPPNDPTQEIAGTRSEFRVKISRMRLRIAQRLKEAQNENAMLTTFNEIDMSNIIAFRKMHQEAFTKKNGVKLGFMSAFVKAATYALQDQPVVNAFIDGNEIVYRDFIDISVAVATPKGLLVPVIRNVGSMNFADIEKSISVLGEKARSGKLAIEDMDGGTFTISNGGVFGSLMGTPIINPPQSAILGMHATFDRPVAIKGQVVIKPMMYVALTYDHRLIDGREAVLFLRKIKDGVENPTIIVAGL